jgi:hypothetical protein
MTETLDRAKSYELRNKKFVESTLALLVESDTPDVKIYWKAIINRAFISKGIPMHYSRESYDPDVHTCFYIPRDAMNSAAESLRITINTDKKNARGIAEAPTYGVYVKDKLSFGGSNFSELLDSIRILVNRGFTYSPMCIDGSQETTHTARITTEAYYDSLTKQQLKDYPTYEDAKSDETLKKKVAEAETTLWNRRHCK